MPWYNGNYPPSYKNQPKYIRDKATEIANEILEESGDEGLAIATGLKKAREYFEEHPEEQENDHPDPDEIREEYALEDDSDTLEPFDDETEDRVIDMDDPAEVAYWADQFQISEEYLKTVVLLNGNAVKEIKKYLSV